MAGLLPSEGKLRGSPANILGRHARDRIGRAFLFRRQGPRNDFRRQDFLRAGVDNARDAERRTRYDHHRNKREKSALHAGLRDDGHSSRA
jgi:hypothetical protein